jgi:hypothetical protein
MDEVTNCRYGIPVCTSTNMVSYNRGEFNHDVPIFNPNKSAGTCCHHWKFERLQKTQVKIIRELHSLLEGPCTSLHCSRLPSQALPVGLVNMPEEKQAA